MYPKFWQLLGFVVKVISLVFLLLLITWSLNFQGEYYNLLCSQGICNIIRLLISSHIPLERFLMPHPQEGTGEFSVKNWKSVIMLQGNQ